ncbi:LANO_0D01068g1_1 [Lachancea nothofagi CBS 11611]|uniref:ER membrane protein complex subunit 4 n=1 Tax=Lachancea nothofagi CBS 11611 TaxID=1266666 RepID=A0A1G4JD61_9SACH|nr:LANO_0D01068g1_1 [Lachancea nothofagi CBS 11611]
MAESIPSWANNLCDPDYAKKIKVISSNSLPLPPGFKRASITNAKGVSKGPQAAQKEDLVKLVVQKAWQIAFQPAKSIPMNMVVSYMSGSSLQIISITTAVMFVSNPIKSIASIRQTFKPVQGNKGAESQVMLAMAIYIVFQIILMGIGIHKLNSMGLIPNTKSDWLFLEKPTMYKEKSYGF